MSLESLDRRTLLKGAAATAGVAALGGTLAPQARADNWKILPHEHQWQDYDYNCGPCAARVVLTCRNIFLSQDQLIAEIGTTTNGTDDISQVTTALNNHVGGWYENKYMPNDPPTQGQKDLLWNDIVFDIDRGYGLVLNIWAPANNHPPGYPNYLIMHYVAAVGYNPDNRQVYIVDSAGFSQGQYWLDFEQVASLVPPKGYSA
ncbi:C39 family peptidase [Luteipulveratus mongoliensis]|uniref:C39 family peptidase n=1 Tax=Luteipulveratus mongoliensis TaxID=571913 RepID=UPI0009F8A22C|nr:C39 family peptidase [Luteipulveratus mongoliensis]